MQVAPKTCIHSSSAFANLCGSVLQMHEYLSWVLEVVVSTSEMATNGGADWMPALRYSSHQPSELLHQVVTSWPFQHLGARHSLAFPPAPGLLIYCSCYRLFFQLDRGWTFIHHLYGIMLCADNVSPFNHHRQRNSICKLEVPRLW